VDNHGENSRTVEEAMTQPDANQAPVTTEELPSVESTVPVSPAESSAAPEVTEPVPEEGAIRMSASSLLSTSAPVAAPAAPPALVSTQAPLGDMRVYVLANQKGGVAKTTTTLNLAVAFAEAGHRVLCIDLDPQANLTVSQGIEDDLPESMYNVLLGQIPIKQIIQKCEIDVAVSSIDVAGAELALSSTIGRERALQRALIPVKDDYDFVFIDTPPSLGLLTINAFTAAHRVIVPVQCEYLSMRGLLQLENTLEMVRENLNPNVKIQGIVPTMVDTRTLHAQEAIELLEENFQGRVFRSRINRTVRFAEAPVQGMSIMKYEPKGAAAKCYRDLAKEVMADVQ